MRVQVDGVGVEVALQWCSDTFSDLMVGFVNSVKTIDGGTHIEGFKVRVLSGSAFPFQCQSAKCLQDLRDVSYLMVHCYHCQLSIGLTAWC